MTARRRRRVGAGAAVAVGISVALVAVVTGRPAEAHFLGYDSVDDCEIRWEDETVFDTERQAAQAAWEALKGDTCVDLAPDVWYTNADLEWKDTYRSDVGWAGVYENESGADDIYLNEFFMRQYGSCLRRMVAMHELGHAHGLAHNSSTSSVMNSANTLCSLGEHDIGDYEALWGPSDPPEPSPTTASTHTP